jgi:type IV fimbrial biogenesis protein FimT
MRRPPPARGFTLAELMVTIALLAVIAGLAVPSFASALARHRLLGAAEELALDLAEARHDAAQRGTTLHLHFEPGAHWCYAVATAPGCGCHDPAPCQLKRVSSADHPGVDLVEAGDATLSPEAVPAGGPATGHALLQGADGRRLRIALTPLGRARICAPAGAVRAYPGC